MIAELGSRAAFYICIYNRIFSNCGWRILETLNKLRYLNGGLVSALFAEADNTDNIFL